MSLQTTIVLNKQYLFIHLKQIIVKKLLILLNAGLLFTLSMVAQNNKLETDKPNNLPQCAEFKNTKNYIAQIQAVLKSKGFYSKSVDNLYGKGTETALKSFQSSKNIDSQDAQSLETLEALNLCINTLPNKNQENEEKNKKDNDKSEKPNDANGKALSIQKALKEKGLYDGPLDNILSPELKEAILRFQKENNLPMGTLNIPTLKALGIEL